MSDELAPYGLPEDFTPSQVEAWRRGANRAIAEVEAARDQAAPDPPTAESTPAPLPPPEPLPPPKFCDDIYCGLTATDGSDYCWWHSPDPEGRWRR